MALEILAFVCWIDLHRRAGRGRRLPGVRALQPDSGKWSVLALLGGHAVLLFFGMVRLRELLPFAVLLAAAGLALAFMLALRARRRAEVFLCAG
jgi:cell division protein FtsW (lipid II flippase)